MFCLYRKDSDVNQTWYTLIGEFESEQDAEEASLSFGLSSYRIEEHYGWGSSILFETPSVEVFNFVDESYV